MSTALKKRILSAFLTFIAWVSTFAIDYLTQILNTLPPWTEKALWYTIAIMAIRAIIKEFIPDSYK